MQEPKYPTSDSPIDADAWLCRWDGEWEVREEEARDPDNEATRYDLADRLLQFSVRIIRLVEELPNTKAGNHIATQLLRAGTSPCANHGEAQAAESMNDFVHKLHVVLKELRETFRWLRLIQLVPLLDSPGRVAPLTDECDQLIRIFCASIRTARNKK